jgi:flagellin-like protein
LLLQRRPAIAGRTRGVSEIIGVLVMVAITVAIAAIILFYVQGLFGTLTKGGSTTHITVMGQMTIPGGDSSTAVLSVTVRNGGSNQIESVTLSCPTAYFSTADCTPVELMYNGAPVGPPNPLATGQTAAGSGAVSSASGVSFVSGTTYVIVVTANFQGGSVQSVALSVPSTS